MRYRLLAGAALGACTIVVAATRPAAAHAVAGARVFVNTLLIDDPGVGDEAALPTISVQSPDGGTTVVDANVEYDKTITDAFGIGVGTDFDVLANDQSHNGKTHAGFDAPYVQLKYRWLLLPAQEIMSSVGVTRNFGRAGTPGFDDGFNSTTVSGYVGKGFGNLPIGVFRALAVTGELDYAVPDAGLASGAGDVTTWSGGLSLQYSIPYLQSQIRDIGLGQPWANMTPVVELAWTSAAGRSALGSTDHPTSFLLGTGAVWTGTDYALSAEILWPLNGAAGHGIGAIGQFHLYFDDIFPQSIGKPIF
jgi:hypothetical protein